MKVKIEIKSVLGIVLFEFEKEGNTIKQTLEEAVRQRADLRYADLRYADLSSADLRYADLRYANLSSADLRYADLSYADLSYADLRYADLRYADLSYADLSYADLRYAKWDFEAMKKDGTIKYLDVFKNDLWAILLGSNEVDFLLESLKTGKVDGSTYEGECCCLVGTIAKSKGKNYNAIEGLTPDAGRPAEKWFTGISKGDTPENSEVCKLTVEWVEEFKNKLIMQSA